MQFFDTEAITRDPSIGKICDEYTNEPSATPADNIALIQAPATNDLDQGLYHNAFGSCTSGLSNVDQQLYHVPKGYVFPSSLLPRPNEEADVYTSLSSSSSSPSSSSAAASPPTSPEWDGAKQESDSIASPQPISPKSQNNILSLINEYTKE
ncbi:hypothetical protein F5Y16DRAFT_401952 [Xylariaceae sp. FL0255]|nr:hypothetical protein F5Y16DRAFT_401952 [Xylariaceae sp. FL0255]